MDVKSVDVEAWLKYWTIMDHDSFCRFLVNIEKNGGDDGTRTRDLCRDRAAL